MIVYIYTYMTIFYFIPFQNFTCIFIYCLFSIITARTVHWSSLWFRVWVYSGAFRAQNVLVVAFGVLGV